MNKKEVVVLISCIKINYYNQYTQDEAELLTRLWYDCLKDYDFNLMYDSLKEVIIGSKYPPQIHDLIDVYNKKRYELLQKQKKEKEELERKKIMEENEYIDIDVIIKNAFNKKII